MKLLLKVVHLGVWHYVKELRKLTMYKRAIIVILCWFVIQPISLNAQDFQKQIKGLNRRLFKFRQEFLELKEQAENKEGLQKKQQEQFDLQTANLQKINQDLIQQVGSLTMQVEKFELQLESSATTQLTSDLTNLRKLIQILVLKSLNETQIVDDSLLEIINAPTAVVPRDLLLLFLAELMQHNQEWEQSLGYYGVLLDEFPESPHFPKAIYEMSEIFGKLDQTEEQKTLLLQLVYAETDVYTQLAKEKLESLDKKTDESLEQEPKAAAPLNPEESIVVPSSSLQEKEQESVENQLEPVTEQPKEALPVESTTQESPTTPPLLQE